MGKLSGKTALITGASKGIGEGIAKAYAACGANLILAARSSQTQELANRLCLEGCQAMAVEVDVNRPESIRQGICAGIDRFGQIDILVNNARDGKRGSIERTKMGLL